MREVLCMVKCGGPPCLFSMVVVSYCTTRTDLKCFLSMNPSGHAPRDGKPDADFANDDCVTVSLSPRERAGVRGNAAVVILPGKSVSERGEVESEGKRIANEWGQTNQTGEYDQSDVRPGCTWSVSFPLTLTLSLRRGN